MKQRKKQRKKMTKWERFKECEELIDFYKRSIYWENKMVAIYPKHISKIPYYEQRLNALDLELKDLYSYYVVYDEWWMKEHFEFPMLMMRE